MKNRTLTLVVVIFLCLILVRYLKVQSDILAIDYNSGKSIDTSNIVSVSFTEVAFTSGIIVDSSGTHGASIADIDGDGDPDIFVNSQEDYKIPSGHYPGNYFFRNNGDGTFTRIDSIAGVQDLPSYAHAALFFDMDHDGDYDLAIGHGLDGLPRRGLFRNNGNGIFTQIDATSGFENTGDIGTRSIVAGDMNGDGFMDIYFSSWGGFNTEYYWGNGTGHFYRHTGLNDSTRQIQGMTMADLDRDGDLDVLMGNFESNDGIGYYQNNGNGVFTRVTGTGLPDSGNGTSVNLGDIDRDGDLDVLLNGRREGYSDLYENLDSTFSIMQSFSLHTGRPGGYGGDNGAFGDFDNDGDLDLYLPSGIAKIWLNMGDGNYVPLDDSSSGVIYEPLDSRFPVLLDYDQDGDLDLFLSQHDGPAKLFRNNLNNGQFLRIKLIGPKGDVGGFGTKVWLYDRGHLSDPDHLIMFQEAMASAGYCIQHEPVLHFGVGNRSQVDLKIEFPNRFITTMENVTAGQILSISVPVPVELSFFSAKVKGKSIVLNWMTATETSNYGFEVERSRNGSDFIKIGFVNGAGTTLKPQNYSFIDKRVQIGTYYYRLKQININGSFRYSEVIEAMVPVPARVKLKQNYPNPFNTGTIISYQLCQPSWVILKVFNLSGQKVITLNNEHKQAGYFKVFWNGRDDKGREVSSGIYIYRLQASEFTEIKKMIKLK